MRRFLFMSLAITASIAAQTTAAPAADDFKIVDYLRDSRIVESSGLATSSRVPGVLYTHNDSGDGPRFFAVGPLGHTRGVFRLVGAGSRDWEDMAAGPGRSLWLGDIGDNARRRGSISVFRVNEPAQLHNADLSWTQYDFRYGDGRSHNAEALLVNPTTGRLYVVTKSDTDPGVYKAPSRLRTSGYNTLARVATAPKVVTGGDFSPDGHGLVLRNYRTGYHYSRLGAAPTAFALPVQRQGESITYSRSGASLLVGSEGSMSPVWRVGLPTG